MTLFWKSLSVFFLMMALVGQADAAKRFGSGGFGKSFGSPAPSRPAPQKQQPVDQKNLNAAPAQKNRGGMATGILGGLLAGGMFAWLLGSGAFEGIQLMDILLFTGILFILFKLLRSRRRDSNTNYRTSPDSGAFRVPPEQHSSESHPMSSVMSTGESAPMNLPDDFDATSFIGVALDHYRAIQDAWNQNDLNTIEGYVSPDVFESLVAQRGAMTVAPKTEVLDLAADIVRADQEGDIRQISILFRGRCRDLTEGTEDGIFDTWHLARDVSGENSPWLIVGIEAE